MQSAIWPDLEAEIPTAIVNVPAWSENYCFDGYDPSTDVGIWFHLGRWPRNPTAWREQLLIYLPDGDHLVIRAFGNHPVENGVGGALLRLECLDPGRKWRLSFSGAARHLPLEKMMQPPKTHLSDGPFVTCDVDLVFSATYPAWDMGQVEGENWCTGHYEQHGKLAGTITYVDSTGKRRTVEMNGNAYRDHSRGPRELSNFAGFYWHHAQFPNGRAFAVVRSYQINDGVRSVGADKAVVFDGDRMLPATVDEVPILTDGNLPPERYQITIRSELGEMKMQARLLRTIAQSSDSAMDQYDGIATPEIGGYFCFEQPTEYIWDGMVTNGWTERAETVQS